MHAQTRQHTGKLVKEPQGKCCNTPYLCTALYSIRWKDTHSLTHSAACLLLNQIRPDLSCHTCTVCTVKPQTELLTPVWINRAVTSVTDMGQIFVLIAKIRPLWVDSFSFFKLLMWPSLEILVENLLLYFPLYPKTKTKHFLLVQRRHNAYGVREMNSRGIKLH